MSRQRQTAAQKLAEAEVQTAIKRNLAGALIPILKIGTIGDAVRTAQRAGTDLDEAAKGALAPYKTGGVL